jgi:integrase
MRHYLALLYYLGCRPGEARGLMWQDVDWDRDLIRIARDIDYKASGQPGALKNAASDRYVPVPAPLRALLQPMRGLPDTYIAHAPAGPDKPLSKSSADRLWVNLMAAAGMTTAAPDDGKFEKYDPRHKLRPMITPPTLRHNYITMCWEHGLDPYETMKLVGHASIATTMNIYTHLSEAQMAKTAAKLDDMFAGSRVASKLHHQ